MLAQLITTPLLQPDAEPSDELSLEVFRRTT
jgi:hypothetical protein